MRSSSEILPWDHSTRAKGSLRETTGEKFHFVGAQSLFFFLSGIVVLCYPCAMFAPPGERVSFLPLNFDLAPEMSRANPVFN